MVNKSKFTYFGIFIALLVILLVFTGCEIGTSDKIMNTAAISEMQIPIEMVCCNRYDFDYANADSEKRPIRYDDSYCCEYTNDSQACRTCIEEYVPPVYKDRGYNSRSNNLLYFFIAVFFVGILSLLTLIVNGIVHIVRKNGFLGKAWLISLWIVFGLCLIVDILILFLINS